MAADVDALLGIVYADALEVVIFGFVGIGIDVGDAGLDVAGGGEGNRVSDERFELGRAGDHFVSRFIGRESGVVDQGSTTVDHERVGRGVLGKDLGGSFAVATGHFGNRHTLTGEDHRGVTVAGHNLEFDFKLGGNPGY